MFEEMMVRNCAPTLAGIRVIPMSFSDAATLIYVYRPEKLNSYLSQDVFPNEIGLFLGYPAEDVKGFMEEEAVLRC